jgi:hypothetical protein
MTDLRQVAQQALEAWDKPSASFDAWWDGDYDDPANPYEPNSAAYWAWAGWKAAQQQAEPFAWAVQGITQMLRGEFAELDAKSKARRIGGTCVAYPLYTVPPQRPWVGLTDEDRRKFAAAQYGWEELLIAAEAKLKEKNT